MDQATITDETTAYGYALDNVDAWGDERGWTDDDRATVRADIETANSDADPWYWTSNAATFWEDLSYAAAGWPDSADLEALFASAAGTVTTTATETSYDYGGMAQGMVDTAGAYADDVSAIGAGAAEAAQNPYGWALGAGITAAALGAYLLL